MVEYVNLAQQYTTFLCSNINYLQNQYKRYIEPFEEKYVLKAILPKSRNVT